MTSPAQPPLWAEPVLRQLLPPDRLDDVTGDLLETFRDDPALSAFRAQAWWGRQVLGVFLRMYWVFPLLLLSMGIVSDLLNGLGDVHGNPPLHGLPIFTLLAAAGTLGGFRTRRTVGGVVAAVGTHLIWWTGIALWWAVSTYPIALKQQQSTYWINAWHWSAAPGETFMHWIVWDNVGATVLGGSFFLLVSFALGLIGGFVGSRIPRGRQPARA